ncbi:MAG: PhoX family phosphatase [Planctomycetota bacterium]
MSEPSRHAPSEDDGGETRMDEVGFDRVVERSLSRRSLSRRGLLGGVLALGPIAGVMGTGLLGCGGGQRTRRAEGALRLSFTPVPARGDDRVHVPAGFVDPPAPLVRWGDPIFEGVEEFDHASGGSAEDSDRVFGENCDGMESFVHGGRQLLAVNHEYANPARNLPESGGTPQSAADVLKLQSLQGVSVIEVRETDRGWRVVKESPFNRRITHNTPMAIVGPAAGHPLLRTSADPTGTRTLGTMANCGSGRTPWGTYLTCEENFNGYFGSTEAGAQYDEVVAVGYGRYGIGAKGVGYDYHRWDERFDTSRSPNEPHRAGWVVEIDPTDPNSTPKKHTGLGRFKHENAECALAGDGRVVVYMGDDERGEFLYRFVSNDRYVEGQSTEGLLDEGTLYAAKFDDDGLGTWLALTPETTGMELGEMLIFAREAASRVGATTMDRPEWVAVHPSAAEAYCSLTNNTNRGVKPNAGGDATPVDAVNPRERNRYGQVVRWRPDRQDHGSTTFAWDLYVVAGNPAVHDDDNAGSPNVTRDNMFNSPDGMTFDRSGLLWIQTDGSDSDEGDFAGMGNNQMLVGDPETGEIARFMTGPKGCEITGLTWSADGRTLFVGIQHPGGSWPDGEGLPRSSVLAVQRSDGGVIG